VCRKPLSRMIQSLLQAEDSSVYFRILSCLVNTGDFDTRMKNGIHGFVVCEHGLKGLAVDDIRLISSSAGLQSSSSSVCVREMKGLAPLEVLL